MVSRVRQYRQPLYGQNGSTAEAWGNGLARAYAADTRGSGTPRPSSWAASIQQAIAS